MTRRLIALLAAIGILYVLTAWAQKLHSPQQLAVYDADGKRVGVVTGTTQLGSQLIPRVAFKVGEVPFMLTVFRDGLVGVNIVGWESDNCSGTPLLLILSSEGVSTIPYSGVGVPGSTVYVEDGPARVVNMRSYSTVPTGSSIHPPWLPRRCVAYQWPSREAVPARPLIDMDAYFKPPFTVR